MADKTYSTIHTSGGPFGEFDIAPLTTVWSAPNGCPSIVTFGGFDTITSSCYPPDYESVWYNYGFYSPGICPDGYTSGCEPTDTDYGGPIRATETAVICVPSSYSCSGFLLHATSVSGDNTASVPAFQIRWAEDDLPALETPPVKAQSGTSTPESTSEGGIAPTPTENSSPKETGSSSSSSSLPTGAVVGIAVGSAAFVAIVAAILFFLFRRRARNASQKNQPPPVQDQPDGGRAELETTQPVQAAVATKQPYGDGTVAELGPHEKGSPLAGYTGDGQTYIPTNAHGSGMPPELPYDTRSPTYELHSPQDIEPRHELGVQERSIAEMDGSLPHGRTSRHELS